MLSWSQKMLPMRQHLGASCTVVALSHCKNVASSTQSCGDICTEVCNTADGCTNFLIVSVLSQSESAIIGMHTLFTSCSSKFIQRWCKIYYEYKVQYLLHSWYQVPGTVQ